MKSGLTIVEMAQQIERQSKLKQDYLLDTRRLQVEPFGSQLYLHTFDDHDDPLVEPLDINQIAHRQIGTHLKIPAAYYDRMLSDYPELLAENVNSARPLRFHQYKSRRRTFSGLAVRQSPCRTYRANS